jgi:hypothetical protein
MRIISFVGVEVGRDSGKLAKKMSRENAFGQTLTCHPGIRTFSQGRVQHGVADLIADLVRMALGHAFTREDVPSLLQAFPPFS